MSGKLHNSSFKFKGFVITFTLLLHSVFSFAQHSKSQLEIDLAKRLKGKYPDDEVCCLKSVVKYSFRLKSDSLIAFKEWSEEFASTRTEASVTIFEMYDDFSELKTLEGFIEVNGKYTKRNGFFDEY